MLNVIVYIFLALGILLALAIVAIIIYLLTVAPKIAIEEELKKSVDETENKEN